MIPSVIPDGLIEAENSLEMIKLNKIPSVIPDGLIEAAMPARTPPARSRRIPSVIPDGLIEAR